MAADYWPLEKPGMDALQTRRVIGRYTVELHERTRAPLVLRLCLDRVNHRQIWIFGCSAKVHVLNFLDRIYGGHVLTRQKKKQMLHTHRDVCVCMCVYLLIGGAKSKATACG